MKKPTAGVFCRIAGAIACLIGLSACATSTYSPGASQRSSSTAYETRSGKTYSESEIKAIVVREAKALGLDPGLALAIARAESNFNPNALSPKGAIGVMQIMPATARGEYGVSADRLWDPETNIRLGLRYYKKLLDMYGRPDIALSHYNGGGRVRTARGLEVIPATRKYVDHVTDLHTDFDNTETPHHPRSRTASRETRTREVKRKQAASRARRPMRTAQTSRSSSSYDDCLPVKWREEVEGRSALVAGWLCQSAQGGEVVDLHVVEYLD